MARRKNQQKQNKYFNCTICFRYDIKLQLFLFEYWLCEDCVIDLFGAIRQYKAS